MIERAGFLDHVLNDSYRARREWWFTGVGLVKPWYHELLDLRPNVPQIGAEVFEDVGGNAVALLDQAQKDVLGPDVVVIEAPRLLARQLHHLAGAVGKALVHRFPQERHDSSPGARRAMREEAAFRAV